MIITAGGAGVRMGAHLPKQFIELNGLPILFHTINKFISYNHRIKLVLVLPANQFDFWGKLCQKYEFQQPIELVEGGPTRFHSVKNGLKAVADNALVAIHDGVRPLVSINTISEAFNCAEKFGNAIPVLSATESIRKVEGAFNKVIDRNAIRFVQTPQCFHSEIIKKAYATAHYNESFTDDATVLEQTGKRIYMVQGNKENIKITSPEDLFIAKALLEFAENYEGQ